MIILTYTSFEEIRAVLGVTAEELEDVTLALPVYEHSLLAELNSISSSLVTTFDTVSNIADDARSVAQSNFYGAMRVFAPYAVAVQLASSLPLFAPKDVTDGKAAVGRDSSSPYKVTIERCQANYDRFRALLITTLAGLTAGAALAIKRPFMRAASPTSDPVTGT